MDRGVRGDLGNRSIGERGQAPVLGPRAVGRVLLLVTMGSAGLQVVPQQGHFRPSPAERVKERCWLCVGWRPAPGGRQPLTGGEKGCHPAPPGTEGWSVFLFSFMYVTCMSLSGGVSALVSASGSCAAGGVERVQCHCSWMCINSTHAVNCTAYVCLLCVCGGAACGTQPPSVRRAARMPPTCRSPERLRTWNYCFCHNSVAKRWSHVPVPAYFVST